MSQHGYGNGTRNRYGSGRVDHDVPEPGGRFIVKLVSDEENARRLAELCRSIDPEERRRLRESGIRIFTMEEIDRDGVEAFFSLDENS